MSSMLDVAIGMSAIYLLVSLFVTTVQELIAQLLALRANYLTVGINNLLRAGQNNVGLIGSLIRPTVRNDERVAEFYSHPMIAALNTNRVLRTAVPSYISKDTFAAVALDLTHVADAGTAAQQVLQAAAALDVDGATPLHKAIAVLAREAGGDIHQLKEQLGKWFDDAMERVSGAYKRWVQVATLVIGFLIAVAANVDTLKVAGALIDSPQVAASFAQSAQALVQANPTFKDDPVFRNTISEKLKSAIEDAKLPIGWQDGFTLQGVISSSPTNLLGWMLTALAASLGAAFWFDTLKRFVSIRSSGRKPKEK
jgi:hypothetical protein